MLARATQAGDEWSLEPQHFQFAVAAPMLPTETAAAAPATGSINLREATDSFSEGTVSRALGGEPGQLGGDRPTLELDVANLHQLAKRPGA
ncbi:hypothetical protein LNP74_05295 [Klebsiella pneumoniae subsp. pneumoniae]|nr:hypothetical protein [Klebsiella pneumoniae subsp. pneumoniae]